MTQHPHGKAYVRTPPKSWWLHDGRYVRYMVRELTCVFVAFSAVVLMVGVYRLSQGKAAFDTFMDGLWSPQGQIFVGAIVVMSVIHSMTWFNLTPKAMPLWINDKPVPGWIIVGAHYVAWVLTCAAVFLFTMGVGT